MPLISLVTFLPLLGAAFIIFLRGDEDTVARNARWAALWTSLVVFVLSLFLWLGFDSSSADFQFVEQRPWLPQLGLDYHMGVDGISLWFVLLSTVLTAGWRSKRPAASPTRPCPPSPAPALTTPRSGR